MVGGMRGRGVGCAWQGACVEEGACMAGWCVADTMRYGMNGRYAS